MHILNVMFSRDLGGIEQSFIDYCEALKSQGCKVTAMIHPDAAVRPALAELGINITNVKNLGHWDFFAKLYIKKILKQIRPDAIIAHGNRAVELTSRPAKAVSAAIIGVTHNYNTKRFKGVDAVFATTEDLKYKVIAEGMDEAKIYKIPNMIRVPGEKPESQKFHKPPVIGTMGRFVKKKGFDVFLLALSNLKEMDVEFKAIIGGAGEEEKSLKKMAKELDLEENVNFTGWIKNKSELFDNIDIFCLPSLHEPFGIILLEAFASGKAVVTTDSEGPSEIAANGKDALVVTKADNNAMAAAIKTLLESPRKANNLAAAAFETVQHYSIDSIGNKIVLALREILKSGN